MPSIITVKLVTGGSPMLKCSTGPNTFYCTPKDVTLEVISSDLLYLNYTVRGESRSIDIYISTDTIILKDASDNTTATYGVGGTSTTPDALQIVLNPVFPKANSVTGLITGNYYKYNTYTKELETFLPVITGYDGTTITPGNESTYIDGVIYVKVGSLYYKKQFYGALNVKWFGAVGDWNGTTGTDNYTAFQTAVNLSQTLGSNGIDIPSAAGEKYYVGTKINITSLNYRLFGDAPVQNLYFSQKSYITGAAGLTAIFDFGNNQNISPNGAIYVEGLAFYKSGTLAPAAIKISVDNNGPARGIVFNKVSAAGFTNAILLDCPTANNVVGGTVKFDDCNFTGCTNSVNGADLSYGLVFNNNQSENGGNIIGKFDGGIDIRNNILEGNVNAINIDAFAPQVTLEQNYFEANSGSYVARFKGTNANATIQIGKNFGLEQCTSTDLYSIAGITKVIFKHRENSYIRKSALTYETGALLAPGTDLKGSGFFVADTTTVSGYLPVQQYGNSTPVTAVSATNQNLGSTVLTTPLGTTNTGMAVSGYSSSFDKPLSISYTATDHLVITALVKLAFANGEDPVFYIYDQAMNPITEVGYIPIPSSSSDEWFLFTAVFKAGTSGTGLVIRFGPSEQVIAPDALLYVAGIGAYKVPAYEISTFNSTSRVMVRPFVPFTPATVVNSLSSNSTTVGRVVLNSDIINNNAVANTIQDVTGLSFSVTAGNVYKFRFEVHYTSAATTTGSRWAINGPASPTDLYVRSKYTLAATTETTNYVNTYDTPAAANATSLTVGNMCIIEGSIKPSVDGTVIARFASEVASSAITSKAGSYVEYQQIN